MRVLLFVSLIALVLQQANNVNQTHRPDQPQTDPQSRKQDSPSAGSPQIVVYERNTNHEQKKVQGRLDSIHLDSVFTGIIALFTILTYFVYREQLRAAKISERAWIVPEVAPPIQDGGMISKNFQVVFSVVNKGRTPAWVTAIGSKGQLTTPKKGLSEKPEYDWAKPFPAEGTVMPPEGRIEQGFPLTVTELNDINGGVSTLYVFGAVKYRDIYGDKHETQYCYVFRTGSTADNPAPRGFYVAGPNGYNSAS
jgi:hypothetical protein